MPNLTQQKAEERAELYYMAHPGSPSAVRRPRLMFSRGLCIAFIGVNVQSGIAGFGHSVEDALHSFDEHYLAYLRPPVAA